MMTKLTATVAMFALCAMATLAGQTKPTDAAAILIVLQALVDSQVTFDQKRMDSVLAPDYVEISPVGDVDDRAKVLGFYAPAQKPPGPAGTATLSEVASRGYGEMAVTIAKLTFNITMPNGEAATRAMRTVFVTRNIGGRWLIVSSQFTPIRTK
jgi:ketosteroid isomerase-like protein